MLRHTPSRHAPPPSSLAGVFVDERDCDAKGVVIPRPEIRLVVRKGPRARNGMDVHALGVRQTVYRKLLQRGQRTVSARLQLGTSKAVLGVAPSAIAGHIVAIEDLWGHAATQRLYEQLAAARAPSEVIQVLDRAVAERLARTDSRDTRAQLVLDAVERLAQSTVRDIAVELGVSERHLRRIFHETLGVRPKAFAKLKRFERVVNAAGTHAQPNWASLAAATGYYDQAHLIAEFRAIAGVTPRALLSELRDAPPIGWAADDAQAVT
jgi:AraC-like DNA-binding protein